jgi:hypothetical protein
VYLYRIVSAILIAGVLAGCGGSPLRDVPNPATGLITLIETTHTQGETTRAHLLTPTGERFAFRIESLLREDPSIDLAHLHQHWLQQLPVVITWRRAGDELVALEIEDAPVPASPTPTVIPTSIPTSIPSGLPSGLPSGFPTGLPTAPAGQ